MPSGPSTAVTVTRTVPPSGLYLMALVSRLARMRCTCVALEGGLKRRIVRLKDELVQVGYALVLAHRLACECDQLGLSQDWRQPVA